MGSERLDGSALIYHPACRVSASEGVCVFAEGVAESVGFFSGLFTRSRVGLMNEWGLINTCGFIQGAS